MEKKRRRGLFFRRDAAAGAAKDVHVAFVIRPFEEARDEIAFRGYRFFADGAGSLHGFFKVRMAMGTSEDVADSVGFARVERRFNLLSLGEDRLAQGADPRFPDEPPAKSVLSLLGPFSHGGKEGIGEDEEKDADEDEE